MAESVAIPFTLGSRRLASPKRRLETVSWTLAEILDSRLPQLSDLDSEVQGLRVLSAPPEAARRLCARFPGYIMDRQQNYQRHYIAMDGTFEDYLAQFSGKTRSTLRRKQRKMAEANDGALDVREYHTPKELDDFFAHAGPLSARTYQERLLDAGLPSDEAARAEMQARAASDGLRAYLLFLDERPVSYLFLPIEGQTVQYAFLGYDPDHARLSPGTVLQLAALERLYAEQRYRYFDFTPGDGAHKALFGTHSVACSSFLLLAPTNSNRLLLGALDAFDGCVAGANRVADRFGASAAIRQLLRR